jgi:hypothetical protein
MFCTNVTIRRAYGLVTCMLVLTAIICEMHTLEAERHQLNYEEKMEAM